MDGYERAHAQAVKFEQAIFDLKATGCRITSSDIPGLTIVNDRELTIGQVIDLASQLRQR